MALGLVGAGYTRALADSNRGNYLRNTNTHMRLVLGNTIDLSGARDPRISFWHQYDFASNDYNRGNERDAGRVYVSNFFGKSQTWKQVASFTGSQAEWVKHEIDLSEFAGLANVRIMFTITDDFGTECCNVNRFNERDGWRIDDIRIDEVDDTPPAAVDDLQLVGNTSVSADLRWTAPGDDGDTGKARSYDVRYTMDTPLTEDNWDTANLATGEPAPSTSGTIEDFRVTGLDANGTFHFGIKTTDEDGNTSGLSNVVSVSTFAPGTVLVELDAPREVLASTTSSTSTLEVRIDVDQVADLNAASYEIKFDPAVLEVAGVADGQVNGTAVVVGAFNENPAGTLVIAQEVTSLATASGAGYLATITFNVIGAVGSNSDVTSSSEILSDDGALLIPSNWTGASVKVVNVLSGDANGDGAVNALDITKIKRIIVRLDPAAPGADANGDGAYNALDLTKTKRIIVGLD